MADWELEIMDEYDRAVEFGLQGATVGWIDENHDIKAITMRVDGFELPRFKLDGARCVDDLVKEACEATGMEPRRVVQFGTNEYGVLLCAS